MCSSLWSRTAIFIINSDTSMPFNANFMSSRVEHPKNFPCNKFWELHLQIRIFTFGTQPNKVHAQYIWEKTISISRTQLFIASLGCGRCTLSTRIAVTHKESFRRKMREAIYIHSQRRCRIYACVCAREEKEKIFPSAASSRYIILLHAGSMHC